MRKESEIDRRLSDLLNGERLVLIELVRGHVGIFERRIEPDGHSGFHQRVLILMERQDALQHCSKSLVILVNLFSCSLLIHAVCLPPSPSGDIISQNSVARLQPSLGNPAPMVSSLAISTPS